MRRLFEAPPLRGVPIVAIGIPADDELDVEEDSEHEPRRARLGAESVELMGAAPVPGDLLRGPFAVPPARCADGPLTDAWLSRGLVFLSTLPNIHKHACAAQIVLLESHVHELLPRARIAHVSADAASAWAEMDLMHASIRAAGYSLAGATDADRASFVDSLGVGVKGHTRIAHGLFALRDGVFLGAEIPGDQLRTPRVLEFVTRVARLSQEAGGSA